MSDPSVELYVHAIAVEREAAGRYAEFAARMAQSGNAELAALRQRTAGIRLPALESDHSWLDAGATTPRQALAIALRAEKRARAFFEHVVRSAADPALHALAREMAAGEAEHIALIDAALARDLRART